MKILIVENGKQPYLSDIENTLRAKQGIVGGPIDILEPWNDTAVVVLNDEGKNIGLPINRTVGSIEIAGTFFVCDKDAAGNLKDITSKQLTIYKELLSDF